MDNTSLTTHTNLFSLFKTFNSTESFEWQEETNSEENFVFKKSEDGSYDELMRATLGKCLEYLTNQQGDKKLQQTFFTTYRAFSSDKEVFRKLLQRYNCSSPLVQRGVASFVHDWVHFSFYDFSEDFINKVIFFVDQVLTENGHHDLSLHTKEIINSKGHRFFFARDPLSLFIIDTNFRIEKYSSSLIAENLTWIDFHLFSRVRPFELVGVKWSKEEKRKGCPNICSMISRFNMLASWVSSTIVSKEKVQDRADLFTKFVEILEVLLKLKNFSSLFAIVVGLNNTSVFRLRQTYEALSYNTKETFKKIGNLIASERSYKEYRMHLSTTVTAPCIPYLGIVLTDFTFISEGNRTKIGDVINFSVYQKMFEVVDGFLKYQQTSYSIEPNTVLQEKLLFLPFMDETNLYTLSLLREPRVRT